MNTKTLTLLLTLLVAMPAAADQPTLRYQFSGTLQLKVEQDMYPGGREEPLADRRFEMTFAFDDGDSPAATLTAIKGTYTAHGMNQILSTRHLVGQPVQLASDGRAVTLDDPGGDIDLGLVTDGGLHPSALLVDVLPVLPDGPVAKGATWQTVQPVRSLEGWSWAAGEIRYEHEVVDVTGDNGQTVVRVRSQGKTTIGAAEGTTGFVGEGSLAREIEWSFNADTGQLLSLSLQQEGNGTNQLPQGQVQVRQLMRVELSGA